METAEKIRISPSEYLEKEEKAHTRHDYVAGEVVAMTGGSLNHNRITRNLSTAIDTHLRGKSCEVFANDMRLAMEDKDLFTYPDLMIVCGTPAHHDARDDTITNPRVIIEVLSKSTRDYDHGTKGPAYRSIESLEELVLVDQYETAIEHWTRRGNYWEVREIRMGSDRLALSSIELELPLEEIYRDVSLKP